MASTSAVRQDSFAMDTLGPRQRANAQTGASPSVNSGTGAATIEEEPGPIRRAKKEWKDIQRELPPQITRRCVVFFVERYYLIATEHAHMFSQEHPDDICRFVMISKRNTS